MSKSRLQNLIRRQDYYRPMLIALEECGITDYLITSATGRAHPALRFSVNGKARRIALPTSPSSHRAARYIPCEIRRIARATA